MEYKLTTPKTNDQDYSPIKFRKSPAKVAYSQATKEQLGYGYLDTPSKYTNNTNDDYRFKQVKKIPNQFSNLRATVNYGPAKNYKSSYEDTGYLDNQKKLSSKPQNSLRHTVYEKKNDYQTDYRDLTSTSYKPYRNNEESDSAPYTIKVNQAKYKDPHTSKVDIETIKEKLKNNSKMIEQLKKLKAQVKSRRQHKNQALGDDLHTPYAQKRKQAKSYDMEPYTPKYDKADRMKEKKQELGLLSTKPSNTPTMQRSKSSYLHSSKSTSKPQEKSQTITLKDFVLGKNLGEGKFGTVYIAFHRPTGSIFALKKVPKAMIKSHVMIDQFLLELKIQSFFTDSNILKIYGFFDDAESIYLILEYMEQGTLFGYLKRNKTLPEQDAAKKVCEIGKAVYCLHEQGVAHRDIKPENIVMSNNVCKLCDFGWATVCNERRKTYCGTFDYAAPQILSGTQYDMSVDIWCLGVLTYELLFGKAPFYHISRKETMKKILNVQRQSINYPENIPVSDQAKDFIEKCLTKNPEERMNADEVLKHPFMQIEQQTL